MFSVFFYAKFIDVFNTENTNFYIRNIHFNFSMSLFSVIEKNYLRNLKF